MELWEVIIAIGSVGIFILIALRMFLYRPTEENPLKSKKKDEIITTKEGVAIQIKALSDTINRLKADNKSLSSSNSRYKRLDRDESYDTESDKPVPLEILKEAAKRFGMNPDALDSNPELVEWLQEQAKDPEVKKIILQQIKSKKPEDIYSDLPGV